MEPSEITGAAERLLSPAAFMFYTALVGAFGATIVKLIHKYFKLNGKK